MITYGQFKISDVLPYSNMEVKEYCVKDKVFWVKMNSMRYQVFKRSLVCAHCGLVGDRFLLQSSRPQLIKHRDYPKLYRAHFNLFAKGENGKLILMTKDHIIPVSLGGPTHISNLQTMCTKCNKNKDNQLPDSEKINEILNKLKFSLKCAK